MNAIRRPWVFLLGLAACGYPSTRSNVPVVRPGMTENQIVDAARQSPAALLRQVYETHQILVLSFAEHDNERQYQALATLLDQVGRDRRLKYIVLERFPENALVLQAASVTNLNETQLEGMLRQQFPVMIGKSFDRDAMAHWSLCDFTEWAYSWARLMPRVRALNAARPADRPVLVTSIDGITASLDAGQGLDSYLRDSITAARFDAKIWRELQRDTTAKAIVMYHLGHTIRGFRVSRQGRTVAMNFFSTFLQDHPEARPRAALVMVEGRWMRPDTLGYMFKLTERQVGRSPRQAFGIPTAPLQNATAERGDSVFTSQVLRRDTGMHPCNAGNCAEGYQSMATLAEMVDGIIWLPIDQQQNLKSAPDYLPTACASPKR